MEKSKKKAIKLFSVIVVVVVGTLLLTNITRLFKKPSSTFVVEKGSISYEEACTGYLIRDEVVLEDEGNEKRNGSNKIRRRKSCQR